MTSASNPKAGTITTLGAWLLAFIWISPLLFALWAAFHPSTGSSSFDLFAPLTLENFAQVLSAAPFPRYFLNTFLLVSLILGCQLVVCTLAAYAFVCFPFRGSNVLFMAVLIQLMIMPEILLVENYRTLASLGLRDTILGMGLPYLASAFGIFLFRQTFKGIPKELEEAARLEGANAFQILMRVFVPLAKPTFVLLHHPPFPSGMDPLNANALVGGRDEMSKRVRDYPGQLVILAGHIHRPYAALWNGAFCAVGDSPAFQVSLDLAAKTQEPDCIGEPYSYFVYRIDADATMTVHARHVPLNTESI